MTDQTKTGSEEITGFTPGPWEVSIGNRGSIFGDLDNPIHNGDHPYIGTVEGIDPYNEIPECSANARLIASAPTMQAELIQLKEAARELLHLHSCEQEGLQSGKPTPEMWFNAVNKLSEALSLTNKEDKDEQHS